MSLEMAHKVILPPQKNYIPQFLKQRDINSYYSIEGCKISVWTGGKMLQRQQGTFFIPRTSIFQRRASF
jgi:hypothetical protein